MRKRIAGLLVLPLGLVLICWVGYNLLVEMQPQARGINPLPALLFSPAFLYVGQKWIRNR